MVSFNLGVGMERYKSERRRDDRIGLAPSHCLARVFSLHALCEYIYIWKMNHSHHTTPLCERVNSHHY